MWNELNSNPELSDCIFRRNSARLGGGMSNNNSSPTVNSCIFSQNSVSGAGTGTGLGGGMFCEGSDASLTNCLFDRNTASGPFAGTGEGAGLYGTVSSPQVVNCTLSGNEASSVGGAMYFSRSGNAVINNSILWANTPDQIVLGGASVIVRYCDVQSGWSGTGNIDDDPLFVDPGSADCHLSSGSPCIDAADNTAVPAGITTDLDGSPRFVDDPNTSNTGVPGGAGGAAIVDMGAYEFQGVAYPLGDLNCDSAFNGADIDPFFLALGDPAAYAVQFPHCDIMNGDMNCDGLVNGADIDPFFECLGAGGCTCP